MGDSHGKRTAAGNGNVYQKVFFSFYKETKKKEKLLPAA
jgi:hypothetical protein